MLGLLYSKTLTLLDTYTTISPPPKPYIPACAPGALPVPEILNGIRPSRVWMKGSLSLVPRRASVKLADVLEMAGCPVVFQDWGSATVQ